MTTPNVFFVCGAPKSGTTWLQRLLDAHPEITCSGEGHFINYFSDPLAEVVRGYNKQRNLVAERVYEGRPYYKEVDQAAHTRIMRAFILEQLMSRQPGPEVRWVGDKTPQYAERLGSLHRFFPEARFIEIVRDPRDVETSRLHHAKRAGFDYLDKPEAPETIKFVREGAQRWVRSIRPVREFAQAHPHLVHSLRYEDLIDRPRDEAVRIFDFLGVSRDPEVVEAVVTTSSFEALTGRKRGEEDAASFMRKGVVGDWQAHFAAPLSQAMEDVCGDLMRRFGYA